MSCRSSSGSASSASSMLLKILLAVEVVPGYLRAICGGSFVRTPAASGRWRRAVGAGDGVTLPHVFQRLGQGLLLHGAVAVAGVAGEDELIAVTLGGQRPGHV